MSLVLQFHTAFAVFAFQRMCWRGLFHGAVQCWQVNSADPRYFTAFLSFPQKGNTDMVKASSSPLLVIVAQLNPTSARLQAQR